MERTGQIISRKIESARQSIKAGMVARADEQRRQNILNLERYQEFPHDEVCPKEQGIKVEADGVILGGGAWVGMSSYIRFAKCLDCRVKVMEHKLERVQ